MSRGYGQYCPLALATELLGQRWTILIISRLVLGCSTFNAIHAGVPRISPSLLARRLAELEAFGILKKRPGKKSAGPTYHITPAGADLGPVFEQMAIWGRQWARDLETDDLDPAFLAWSMHSRIDTAKLPSGRTVIEFDFTGTPTEFRRFWLVAEDGTIEMCLKDPGFEVDLFVHSDIRSFIDAWRGYRDLRSEIRSQQIRLEGNAVLVKRFPDLVLPDAFSSIARKRPGRERRMTAG